MTITTTPLAPNTAPAIGRLIKTLREAREWSQGRLSNKTRDAAPPGISESSISLIERGLRAPERVTLERLAAALDEDGDALVVRAGLLPAWIVQALDAGDVTAQQVVWALAGVRGLLHATPNGASHD